MKRLLIILSVFLFIIGILLILPVLLSNEISFLPSRQIASLSTLSNVGSYLAGTSGLFISFSGMLLIYLTFMAQIEQLNIQKKEIKESKEQNQIEHLHNTILDMTKRIIDLINDTQFIGINGLNSRVNTPEYLKGYSGVSTIKAILNEKYEEVSDNTPKDFEHTPYMYSLEFLSKNVIQLSSIFSMIEDHTSYFRIAFPLANINYEMCNILKDVYYSGIGTNFIELSDQLCVAYQMLRKNMKKISIFDNLDQLYGSINLVLSYLALEYDEKEIVNDRKHIDRYRFQCMLLSQKKEI